MVAPLGVVVELKVGFCGDSGPLESLPQDTSPRILLRFARLEADARIVSSFARV